MESKRPRSSAAPTGASHAESKVLDDDNLLWEIIVRLGFATDLVRAALVCKRWLGHVSHPGFLRRFRKLHPLRPLGFYVASNSAAPRFVQMLPQPPELAAVCRRASFDLDSFIWGCSNSSVIIISEQVGNRPTSRVYSPLFPSRSMPVVPELPPVDTPATYTFETLLFREGNESGLPYLWLLMESTKHVYKVHVYMLQDGVWSKHTSATTEFPYLTEQPKPLLIDTKIYMGAASSPQSVLLADNTICRAAILSGILVVDLKDSSFSTIQLPEEGVEYLDRDVQLAKVHDDDSGVYLIHLKDLKLRIWLHSSSTNSWSLVDTICLNEMLAALRTADHTMEGEHAAVLRMKEAVDNAEFIFFVMGASILYLDVKCKELRKVSDLIDHDPRVYRLHIYPLMMVWPPAFPAPKDDVATCKKSQLNNNEGVMKLLDGTAVSDKGAIKEE